MTPAQVEEAIRRGYNAESDNFYASDEVLKIIYRGEAELAREALAIEARDTTVPTVIGTRIYSWPSLLISVRRVEYDGTALQAIDFRQDDQDTSYSATTTQTGTPLYYAVWGKSIYLRPVPNAVKTLTIYGYQEPTLLTTASTVLSVPSEFHSDLITYGLMNACLKDKDYDGASYYRDIWDKRKLEAKAWMRKRRRSDQFAAVKDEELFGRTLLGNI